MFNDHDEINKRVYKIYWLEIFTVRTLIRTKYQSQLFNLQNVKDL